MRKLIPLTLLGLVACGGGEDASVDADVQAALDVASEEAAAAEAEAEITAENADDEFEKLKASIENADGDF